MEENMSNIDEFISNRLDKIAEGKEVLINLIIARYNEGVRDGLIIGVKNKTKDDNSFYNRGFDFGIEMTKEIEDDTKSMKELIQSLNNQ
jgi:hypothetical protein